MFKLINIKNFNYQFKGNLFYSKKWIEVLKGEYDFDFYVVVSSSQTEKPIFVFVQLADIFGKRILSLPFSDYTEPLVQTENELCEILNFLKESYKNHAITIKYHGIIDESKINDYKNIRQALCHRVFLDNNSDMIWQKTSRAFKKGVKKAKKHKLYVKKYNCSDGIAIFHQMLTDLRRNKLHILPQPKSYYMRMYDNFICQEKGNLWMTFMDNKPIAAAILLHSGEAMFDKMGVSDSKYLEYRPNNILLWEIMKYGQSNGFKYLDMGLTPSGNEGLMRFKDSLGGKKTPINYYRYLPLNYNYQQEEDMKNVLTKVTKLFVKSVVPDEIVQEAGSLLYQYFA